MINERIQVLAEDIAKQLVRRNETVSVAESTTGGLISASLLSVAGASKFYRGGSVVYTRESRKAFLDFEQNRLQGLKPLTPEMAQAFAEAAQAKLNANWGIAELGASGPDDSPYGHPAGSTVFAVAGPLACSKLLQTGINDRRQNMTLFTEAVLELFLVTLEQT